MQRIVFIFFLVIIVLILILSPFTTRAGEENPLSPTVCPLPFAVKLSNEQIKQRLKTTFYNRYYRDEERITVKEYLKDPEDVEIVEGKKHWDVAVPYGTPIYASEEGVVLHVKVNSIGGPGIEVLYDGGITITYCHLQNEDGFCFVKGQRFNAGDILGYTGTEGKNSTGPHLHLEVRNSPGGELINPDEIFGIFTPIAEAN